MGSPPPDAMSHEEGAGRDSPGWDVSAGARFALHVAWADALSSAGQQGLVLVLDDLHAADAASLYLLRHVAPDLANSGALVVGTYRLPLPRATPRDFADALGDLARWRGTHVVELGRLDDRAVSDYLRSRAGTRVDEQVLNRVAEAASGNPLYLRTATDLLAVDPDADVSGSPQLRSLVRAELAELPPASRELLEVAAVLGVESATDLLASVAGRSETEVIGLLADCRRAGLLDGRPSAARYAFTHALVRDGVYAGIDEEVRVRLHRRAAEVIAGESLPVGALAVHLVASATTPADASRAVHACRRVADDAMRRFAAQDAAATLRTAREVAESSDLSEVERAELLFDLAVAEYQAGHFGDAMKCSEEAARAARVAGHTELESRAALVVLGVGHPRIATAQQRLIAEALRHVDLPNDLRGRLLAQRACAEAELEQMDEADLSSAEALTLLAGAAPLDELEALRARNMARSSPVHVHERFALAGRAVEVSAAVPTSLARLWPHVWRAEAAYQLGLVDVADEHTAAIADLATVTGAPLARWHLLRHRVSKASESGDFARARDLNMEAAEWARRFQEPTGEGISSAFLIFLALLRGDPDELTPEYFEALARAPDMPVVRVSKALSVDLQGDHGQARRLAMPLMADPYLSAQSSKSVGVALQLAELAWRWDDREMAERLTPVLAEAFAACTLMGAPGMVRLGAVERTAAQMALLRGDVAAAVSLAEKAVAVDERVGGRVSRVVSLLLLSEALLRRAATGDLARAKGAAGDAAAEARRLDMPGRLAEASDLVARARSQESATDPLTAREHEVVDLVAQGLTNREIAERLYLSGRTVETHVRNVLAKLDMTTRTQLTAWSLRGNAEP